MRVHNPHRSAEPVHSVFVMCVPFPELPLDHKSQSELGDLGAMGLDSTDLTSSTGFVHSIVCHDSSTAVAPGTGGASIGCLGVADSQVLYVDCSPVLQ